MQRVSSPVALYLGKILMACLMAGIVAIALCEESDGRPQALEELQRKSARGQPIDAKEVDYLLRILKKENKNSRDGANALGVLYGSASGKTFRHIVDSHLDGNDSPEEFGRIVNILVSLRNAVLNHDLSKDIEVPGSLMEIGPAAYRDRGKRAAIVQAWRKWIDDQFLSKRAKTE